MIKKMVCPNRKCKFSDTPLQYGHCRLHKYSGSCKRVKSICRDSDGNPCPACIEQPAQPLCPLCKGTGKEVHHAGSIWETITDCSLCKSPADQEKHCRNDEELLSNLCYKCRRPFREHKFRRDGPYCANEQPVSSEMPLIDELQQVIWHNTQISEVESRAIAVEIISKIQVHIKRMGGITDE